MQIRTVGGRCLSGLLTLAAIGLTASSAAGEEPTLLSLDAGAAFPLQEPQTQWYHPGPAASAGLYFPLGAHWLLGGRIGGFVLLDDERPERLGLEDPDAGGFYSLNAALRIRPFANARDDSRAPGPYLELAAGGGVTEDLLRPTVQPAVGYLIDLDGAALGPFVRYQYVYQPDDELDPSDGHFLTVGLEVVLFDAEESRPSLPGVATSPEPAAPGEPEDPCPDSEEDFDGYKDDDGCADPDNDGDGIPDELDDCPNEPETYNGINDHDGCPDSGEIEVVNDRLVIGENVFFDYDKSELRGTGRDLIEDIAALWRSHEEWVGIRVEGHADSRGSLEYNQELSEERAQAVKEALTAAGMPNKRIESEALGETQPRVENADTPREHQRNRRVEFVVLRAEKPSKIDDRPPADVIDENESSDSKQDADSSPTREKPSDANPASSPKGAEEKP